VFLIVMYAVALTPMLLFIGMYLYEWTHIKRTAESYLLLIFISALAILTINSMAFNVFNVEIEWVRMISRGLQLLVGLSMWYFTYSLWRYQVLPRHRRNKLRKRLRKEAELEAELKRIQDQG
jgi:hypothetical protein